MVQDVKSVSAKLEILLMPSCKVFEDRHVDAVVSRPVDLVRFSAEILNHGRDIRNRCSD